MRRTQALGETPGLAHRGKVICELNTEKALLRGRREVRTELLFIWLFLFCVMDLVPFWKVRAEGTMVMQVRARQRSPEQGQEAGERQDQAGAGGPGSHGGQWHFTPACQSCIVPSADTPLCMPLPKVMGLRQ